MNNLITILLASATILVMIGGWQLVMSLAIKMKCHEKNCGEADAHENCLGCQTFKRQKS